jgi:uncharacterized protein (TIGR02246 family)
MAQAKSNANEKQAIRKQQRGFAAAWNKDNVGAMAAFWAEDGDIINPFGRVAKGRAEVEKLFAEEHSTFAKGSQLKVDINSIRFIKPDVAVVDCAWEASGMAAANGSELPPLKGLYAAVVVKRRGKWEIAAFRPWVPVSPPA